MNINKFKEGDIITRVASKEARDRSYQGDRLEFVGIDKGIIALIGNGILSSEYTLVELGTDWWSEDWEYYPTGLIEKAKRRIKELLKTNTHTT